MTLELTDFEDSTDHLYDVLVADEDIEQDDIDEVLASVVDQQVNQLFNNKEAVAEQLSGEE